MSNAPALPLPSAPVFRDIEAQTEWRFEVAFGSKFTLKVVTGDAALFGTNLAPQKPYTFAGVNEAIYTWHGCRIEVAGKCQFEYLSKHTPMTQHANLHFALEQLRDEAILDEVEGPRVLLIGPESAGKTSLAKLLTAYAVKSGRHPVVVNLDPKEGMLSIPGTLTTASFSSIIDIERGWGSSPTVGPRQVPANDPVVYFYGKSNPEESTQIFKPLVTRLGLTARSKSQGDIEAKKAGCIIDTPGSISQGTGGYHVIQHIVSEFSVDVLVIIGSERLYHDMVRRYNWNQTAGSATVAVVKLNKSRGCAVRDEGYMRKLRQEQVREYFFGDANNILSPKTQQLDLSKLKTFKIAESSVPASIWLLPRDEADSIFEQVSPSSQMQKSILAIVQANPNASHATIRDACVLGLIYVAEVDETNKRMKILAPMVWELPDLAMIWGSWPEGVEGLVD